ncbi:hypothetical protein Hanom_Chr04g00360621 [Helianthus anomalus]
MWYHPQILIENIAFITWIHPRCFWFIYPDEVLMFHIFNLIKIIKDNVSYNSVKFETRRKMILITQKII